MSAVTGPVARFARMIAGHGYICAAPCSYHEFTGPDPLKYDAEDTDKGNLWKISKVRGYIIGCQYHLQTSMVNLCRADHRLQSRNSQLTMKMPLCVLITFCHCPLAMAALAQLVCAWVDTWRIAVP